MAEDSRASLKDFEKQWADWANRPPETPPEEAARILLARLPDRVAERRSVTTWRVLLPAAALVAVAIGVGILWKPYSPTSTETSLARSSLALEENTALIWLDPETPLYLSLPETESAGGEGQ
jgi:hypothetical protein